MFWFLNNKKESDYYCIYWREWKIYSMTKLINGSFAQKKELWISCYRPKGEEDFFTLKGLEGKLSLGPLHRPVFNPRTKSIQTIFHAKRFNKIFIGAMREWWEWRWWGVVREEGWGEVEEGGLVCEFGLGGGRWMLTQTNLTKSSWRGFIAESFGSILRGREWGKEVERLWEREKKREREREREGDRETEEISLARKRKIESYMCN